ncbi:MAG: cellulase family glycosylhydrolase [Candidatus Omnitrophota bacterium]
MSKHKIQNKKVFILLFAILILGLSFHFDFFIWHYLYAQDGELEITIDAASATIPLPKVFRPNVDLSGRGFHHDPGWPQALAAKEVLDIWHKEIGFRGVYRLQYNLWEISQLAKDKEAQGRLLANYENVIKSISDAGGIVILDIFGTPAGLGKVLDKKSPPFNLKAFKELIKSTIRELSCDKRYNVWYEVWNAPDLDDFFLGRKQEYFNLYRTVAESIKELETEMKVHIPIGGPAVSWWFQNLDGNTIATPQKSLIYELIKFCYRLRLPLDFISWHAFSTDPEAEKENTTYKNTAVNLVREWLTYFKFDRNTPLIVDEWNYDRSANVLPERKEKSFIAASYIPARIKNMYEAGVDYQAYFCLEDFKNNKEGVVRNVGIFSFDPEYSGYNGAPKAAYSVFRMLANLGPDMFLTKPQDEFTGLIATKGKDRFTVIIYNYSDPEIVNNYLSRNIAALRKAERKILLNFIKQGTIEKITSGEIEIAGLRATKKIKALLKKAKELSVMAAEHSLSGRRANLNINNLPKGDYTYQRFAVDSSCSMDCKFAPVDAKEIRAADAYQERLELSPYSVQMIILERKPAEIKQNEG